MALCWNLRDVLDINTDHDTFTCVACEHIHELRQRCTTTIDPDAYEAVNQILNTIDTSPNPDIIFHSLGRLSSLTLCTHHQDNISKQNPPPSSEIYSQWKTLIQEKWRENRREESRKAAESYKLNKMKKQLDQMKLCFDDEKEDQIISIHSIPTTPTHHISAPSSPPSSSAVSPTEDTSFLKPIQQTVRRDTFGNDTESSQFDNTQDSSPTDIRESNIDRRPSLRILVQSVLLPSPPQTPELARDSIMEEGAADFMRTTSSLGSYYSESATPSPISPHPKPLQLNNRNSIQPQENNLLFPTEPLPRIPPKSPLRPKSSNFNTKFPPLKTTIIPLPSPTQFQQQDQHSPISPLSSSHSKNSSCSSTDTNTTFLPSRTSFNSFTSLSPTKPKHTPASSFTSYPTQLKPFPLAPFQFPEPEKSKTTNSSTPKIRAPTPTSPTFTKKPKFLIEDGYGEVGHEYEEEEGDYFTASLHLNPYYSVSSETLEMYKCTPSPPPVPAVSNLKKRRTREVGETRDSYTAQPSHSKDLSKKRNSHIPTTSSNLRDEFETSLFCGVCRLARGEGTCECLFISSTTSINNQEEKEGWLSIERRGSKWGRAGGKDVSRGMKNLVGRVVGKWIGKEAKRRNTTGTVGMGENIKGFVGGAAERRRGSK